MSLIFLLTIVPLLSMGCGSGVKKGEESENEKILSVGDILRQIERDMDTIGDSLRVRTLDGVEFRAREIAHLSAILAQELGNTEQRDRAELMERFAQSIISNTTLNRIDAAEADFMQLEIAYDELIELRKKTKTP